MLSTLLPGVREVRPPLVAGSLWLLAIVLIVHDSFPPRDEATGMYALGYTLDGLVGKAGVTASLGVLAYFLGTLSSTVLLGGLPGSRLTRPHVHFVPRTTWAPWPLAQNRPPPPLRAPFGARGHRALLVAARTTVDRMAPLLDAIASEERADERRHQRDVRGAPLVDYPAVAEPDAHHLALQRVMRLRNPALPRASAVGEATRVDALILETSELISVLRAADVEYRTLGPRPDAVTVRRPRSTAKRPPMYWSIERPARSILEEAVADVIVADFEMLRTRLLRPETLELSAAIDRLRSEAGLRFAVIGPLAALLFSLAASTDSVAWLIGLCAVLVLLYAAIQRRKDAGDMLLDALDERTTSPALDRLDADIANVIDGLRTTATRAIQTDS